MVIGALSWNIFHGRDAPPNPALLTRRSRLLRATEADATHAQVNRPLLDEFAAVLSGEPWDIALLQEAPPRWLRRLCQVLGSHGASALTARTSALAAREWLAERNPDLVAASEGGSNQLLVRPPWRVLDTRRLTLTLRPERRRMLWALLGSPAGETLGVANLHATVGDPAAAAREIELAAERASGWTGSRPLVFGGDFNVRPDDLGVLFDRLRERFGLEPPTQGAVDHVLASGLETVEPPRQLPPERREVEGPAGLRLRLSDHAPVAAKFAVGAPGGAGQARAPASAGRQPPAPASAGQPTAPASAGQPPAPGMT